jgi:hypothetical protein
MLGVDESEMDFECYDGCSDDEKEQEKGRASRYDLQSFYVSLYDDHLGVFNWKPARSASLAKKMMIACKNWRSPTWFGSRSRNGVELKMIGIAGKYHREELGDSDQEILGI